MYYPFQGRGASVLPPPSNANARLEMTHLKKGFPYVDRVPMYMMKYGLHVSDETGVEIKVDSN